MTARNQSRPHYVHPAFEGAFDACEVRCDKEHRTWRTRRREFGRLALASVPAAAVLGGSDFFTAFAQAKPNSLIDGVQIGTITYSYRSMPDQSAEATLEYIVDSGISAIELMGGPVESFAGVADGGGPRRWRRAWCRAAPRAGRTRPRRARRDPGGAAARARLAGAWNGTECVIPAPGGCAAAAVAAAAGGAAARPDARAAGGAAGTGGQAEGVAHQRLDGRLQEAAQDVQRRRRDHLRDWKQLSANMSDEEFEYVFNVAEALGCQRTPRSNCRPTTRSSSGSATSR